MNPERPNEPNPERLTDLEPIEESRNTMIINREQIGQYIESPLVKACEVLWDKGVRTLSTSANKKDISEGAGYIIIDFDNLSPQNQEVATSLSEPIEYDGMQAVKIPIPLDETSILSDIETYALEVADKFVVQQANWVPRYTIENLKAAYGIPPDNLEFDSPEAWTGDPAEGGYFYDPKEEVFYRSEEHFMMNQSED